MDQAVSRRLLELRHALCLTQKEFGEKIHISKGYVTSLEKSRQSLNDRIIKLLSDTYGVNPEWLKHGKGAMFLEGRDNQIDEIVRIYNQLNPDFQNFIVGQLKNLLKMNHNYQEGEDGETPPEPAAETQQSRGSPPVMPVNPSQPKK
jgi:transcriptional regulator with XRE-family HTH domain